MLKGASTRQCVTMQCIQNNGLCKRIKKIGSSQGLIETQFFPESIFKINFESIIVIEVFFETVESYFLFFNCSGKLTQKLHLSN